MTRINVGIRPDQLVDKHLLAEIRELPRIFSLVLKRQEKGIYSMEDIPKEFTLGTGHVKFFYNKLTYLYRRFHSLNLEYRDRFPTGNMMYNNTPDIGILNAVGIYQIKYEPTERDRNLLVERISTRLKPMKNLRYKQQPISLEAAIYLLHGDAQ